MAETGLMLPAAVLASCIRQQRESMRYSQRNRPENHFKLRLLNILAFWNEECVAPHPTVARIKGWNYKLQGALTKIFVETLVRLIRTQSTGVGIELIEGLRFLASLLLACTGRTEGGEKIQPFKRFKSRLFSTIFGVFLLPYRTLPYHTESIVILYP